MIVRSFDSKLEWLKWRRGGICASDVPAILGKSKWKNIEDAFNEKITDVENTDNWAMARGREFEPIIRSRLESVYNASIDALCGEHSEKPWVRASFDGINFDKGLLFEIKTAGKEDHQTAKHGLVPDHYYPQVQWQLYTSGFSEGRYVSANENKETGWEIIEVVVQRNDAYLDKIMPEMLRFWNCVQTGVPPTDPISADIASLFEEYAQLWEKKCIIDERMKTIKDLVADITPADGALAHNGFVGKWVVRKGPVDYKNIPQLYGVDLEMFRKEETAYFDLRRGG